MPTLLTLDAHLEALTSSGTALREAAAKAGPQAPVPTCPTWEVTDLVAHQGMVHRWAAANLRGERDYDTDRAEAEGKATPDPLGWFTEGLDALVTTVRGAAETADALVFLKDAPAPRQFWARRQAHETTIHSVDAQSAALGRPPAAAEVAIAPELAADGIDELLCGFLPRRKSRLRSPEPYTILVRAEDTGHAWSVRVSQEPVVTVAGEAGRPDAAFTGSAAQLYLGLWNRGDELTADGPPDLLDQWRAQVRVRWG